MKVVISGITGFLGYNLCKYLLEKNIKIIGLLRKSSNVDKLNILIRSNNLLLYYLENPLLDIFKEHKIDAVIHTATSYGKDDIALNVLKANEAFALELLEATANSNVKLFINTDTFFNVEKILYDYMVYYTTSKKNFVNWGLAFAMKKKINFVNVKLHHLYGFGDSSSKFVENIIRKILTNETKIDLTTGLQKRDFIYIKDAVSAYYYLLENINNYSEYFTEVSLGSGTSTSIKDLVLQIKQIANNNTTKLNFGAIPDRLNEFKESVADLSFLNSIGFVIKYDIKSGLMDYIKQFNIGEPLN